MGAVQSAVQSRVGLLNSWKEIAVYLGRGVRTVQRWESSGLPVRRLGDGPRAPVIADARDIDVWIHSARSHGFAVPQSAQQLLLRGALLDSVKQARMLRDELSVLRKVQHEAVDKLLSNIALLGKSCVPPVRLPPPRD